MNTIFCLTCRQNKMVIKRENNNEAIYFFLNCGHRFITKDFHESINLIEMLGMLSKGVFPFSKKHKFKYEAIVGSRIGKDGKLAYVEQIIDRVNNYYKKFVKQGDNIIKNVEGKLTDHR